MSVAALTFNDVLADFLRRARLLRAGDEDEPVPADDPQRDPGWCHSHNMHRDDEEDE